MKYDDSDYAEPRHHIYQIRKQAEVVKSRCESLEDGGLSEEMHKQLVMAAVRYYDSLLEFKSKTIVDDDDYPDMQPIRSRLGRRKEVIVPSPGVGRGPTVDSRPAVIDIPPSELYRIINELDVLAQKLGFGAKPDEKTDHSEFSHGDLAALLQNRGQSDALEKVPGEVSDG